MAEDDAKREDVLARCGAGAAAVCSRSCLVAVGVVVLAAAGGVADRVLLLLLVLSCSSWLSLSESDALSKKLDEVLWLSRPSSWPRSSSMPMRAIRPLSIAPAIVALGGSRVSYV